MLNIYRKFRGLDGSNQSLEVFTGFLFLFKEFLEFVSRKNSNYIIDETIDSYTPARVLVWLKWRQAKDFVNLIQDFININAEVVDEFKKLEKAI